MKKEIRRFFKNYKERLDPDDKKIYDQKIYDRLINSSYYKEAKTIFIYLSRKNEIDSRKIIKKALDDNKKVYVPKIRKKMIMDAVIINSLDDIVEGKFSIETSKNDEVLESPDLTIVPGLCFDNNKYRIGYGGGYYDYYIKNHKSLYIGLFYSACKIEEIPIKDYDQKLDYIITEDEIL